MNGVIRQYFSIFKNDCIQKTRLCLFDRKSVYRSVFCFAKLYLMGNLKIHTTTFVPKNSNAKFMDDIPLEGLNIIYCRSSGAGGQHVNHVNTKVHIRFNVQNATWLSEEIKKKLIEQYKNKLTKDGCLIIKSELTRSQQANLADALQKLRAMVKNVMKPTSEVCPEAIELKQKQKVRAAKQRLFEKRRHSQIKQDRKAPIIDL